MDSTMMAPEHEKENDIHLDPGDGGGWWRTGLLDTHSREMTTLPKELTEEKENTAGPEF